MSDNAVKIRTEKPDGRIVRGEATRERVLDAAERLFADYGFDAVSIRQIAQEAEVTLGVVGFHSGSKDELFATILKRRADALNAARRAELANLKRSGGQGFGIRDLMAAYINPYIDLATSGDPQWLAYARLIAHLAGDSRWYFFVKDLYDPIAREYLAAILELRPGAPRDRLAAAFVMSVAAMLSMVASTIRIEALTGDGANPPVGGHAGLNKHRSALIDFCAGGLTAALDAGRAKTGNAASGLRS